MGYFILALIVVAGLSYAIFKIRVPEIKKKEEAAKAAKEDPPKLGMFDSCLMWVAGWSLITTIVIGGLFVLFLIAISNKGPDRQTGSTLTGPQMEAFERMNPTGVPTATPLPKPTETPILGGLDDVFVEMGAQVSRGVVEVRSGDTMFTYARSSDTADVVTIKRSATLVLSGSQIAIVCPDKECAKKVREYFKAQEVELLEP